MRIVLFNILQYDVQSLLLYNVNTVYAQKLLIFCTIISLKCDCNSCYLMNTPIVFLINYVSLIMKEPDLIYHLFHKTKGDESEFFNPLLTFFCFIQ